MPGEGFAGSYSDIYFGNRSSMVAARKILKPGIQHVWTTNQKTLETSRRALLNSCATVVLA
jgi:hypothetical protein